MTSTEQTITATGSNSWSRAGAERMIAAICRESYLAANRRPDGTMRKRHVPYSVPAEARALIDALDANDEHEAKRIMHCVRVGALSLV